MRIVIWNSAGVENLLTKGSTDFIRDLSLIKNCTDDLAWKILHHAASSDIPTDSCEASVVRKHCRECVCLSEPVGRVAQSMSEKAV